MRRTRALLLRLAPEDAETLRREAQARGLSLSAHVAALLHDRPAPVSRRPPVRPAVTPELGQRLREGAPRTGPELRALREGLGLSKREMAAQLRAMGWPGSRQALEQQEARPGPLGVALVAVLAGQGQSSTATK